jgi:hypothetical protein
LKLSWDSERPASSNLALGKRKSPLRKYLAKRTGGGSYLSLRRNLNRQAEAALWTEASSLHRIQSWDNNLGLFSLKIAVELARAFLM